MLLDMSNNIPLRLDDEASCALCRTDCRRYDKLQILTYIELLGL